MIWLEEFHINKYVKKYDGRSEHLSPLITPPREPPIPVGSFVKTVAVGKKKFNVLKSYRGRYGEVLESEKVPTSLSSPSGWNHKIKLLGKNEMMWFNQSCLKIISKEGVDIPEDTVMDTV